MAVKKRSPKAAPAVRAKDHSAVFTALCALLQPYEGRLALRTPNPQYYYLESREPTYRGRPMFFAAVRAGNNYVSFHLMPVYGCCELLDGVSADLKKRMQGKACFNFTTVDEGLFAELDRLTQAGYDKFKSLKYL